MSTIIEKSANFVREKLGHDLDPRFLYHNLSHTERVVKSASVLVKEVDLSEEEKEMVLVAAWFHDVGYVVSRDDHEQHSCDMAMGFLRDQGCDDDFITQVCNLIMATKIGHVPDTLPQKVIRDADSSHFAESNFLAISELLREELSQWDKKEYSIKNWRKGNIKVLRVKHQFYTDYAKKNWQKGKDKNLKKLVKAKKKEKRLVKKESLKAKFKGQIPDRGIQTLYRVTLRNHIKLSDIADTKANILLSVNAIIISLALANLVPKLDNPSNDYLIYPTFIFVIFSIAAMIMSILATRPNVTQGEFTKEDVRAKKVNLLFFGNFHRMQLAQYNWAMKELIKDREYIYDSLTKDLYFLGVVLERKYRLLRWTYTIFMIGMILSVIAFGVALKFFGPDRVLPIPDLTQ
ncbi:MAG: Pycsar system effector family protein [Saonia sp.]